MKRILVTLALTLVMTVGKPCSCADAGNFIKASKQSDLIVLVRVIAHDDLYVRWPQVDTIKSSMSVRVEIIEVLKGAEKRKEIKIFGDDGFLCREAVHHFKIGEYFVVGLTKCVDQIRETGVKETQNDYYLSSCGEFNIKYFPDSKVVKGRIKDGAKKFKWMPLDKLRLLITS